MPEVVFSGDERGLAELENAAGEVTPNAEIEQAFGKVRSAYVVPGEAHLAPVAKEEGAHNACDDTARAPMIELVAVWPFRNHNRRAFSLIGHRYPRL